MSRLTGTVKWFNGTKGFGFITPNDGSEDLFVHQSSIKSDGFRSLAEGETVEYVVSTGDDGRTKAVDVSGPDGAPVQGSDSRGSGGGGGGGYGGQRSGGGGGSYGGGGDVATTSLISSLMGRTMEYIGIYQFGTMVQSKYSVYFLAMGWAFAQGDQITKEHQIIYCLDSLQAALSASWLFRLITEPRKTNEKRE